MSLTIISWLLLHNKMAFQHVSNLGVEPSWEVDGIPTTIVWRLVAMRLSPLLLGKHYKPCTMSLGISIEHSEILIEFKVTINSAHCECTNKPRGCAWRQKILMMSRHNTNIREYEKSFFCNFATFSTWYAAQFSVKLVQKNVHVLLWHFSCLRIPLLCLEDL